MPSQSRSRLKGPGKGFFSRLFSGLMLLVAAAMLAPLELAPPVLAQDADNQDADAEAALQTVLTIDGKDFSVNLVGTIITQLPEDIRRQPPQTYYDRIIDDIIDTYLAANASRQSGVADNPIVREIADRARDRVLAEAWIQQTVNERITEEMIIQSYDDFVADAESRAEVRARHILVDTKETAENVITRLDGGEDFATLAKELSTGPSGPNGGELGYFRRGDMLPAFEIAAFGIDSGSYSPAPVQTQYGWHIIYIEDRRVAPAPPIEQMRDQLVQTLSIKMISMIVSELRADASIERMSFEDLSAIEAARRNNQ